MRKVPMAIRKVTSKRLLINAGVLCAVRICKSLCGQALLLKPLVDFLGLPEPDEVHGALLRPHRHLCLVGRHRR